MFGLIRNDGNKPKFGDEELSNDKTKIQPTTSLNMKSSSLFFYLTVFLLLSFSCNHQPKEFADSLWYNGTILTMEGESPQYIEAVAVKDGKILETGSFDNLKALIGETTTEYDLKNQVLLPGFIEPHLHPLLATILIQTEIIAFNDWVLPHGNFSGARSEEAYLKRLDAAVAKYQNKTEPFISWGYHSLYHGEINRAMLDARYGDTPVALWQYSFHEMILNTAALELLQVDQTAAAKHHQANLEKGRFYEKGMQYLVAPKLMPYILNPKKAAHGIQLTAQAIQKGGITTIGDMAMPLLNFDLEHQLIQQVLGHEQTPFRSFLIPMASYFAKNETQLPSAFTIIDSLDQYNTKKIQFVKQIKLMADGAFYSQLMQMQQPYTDGHKGEWLTKPETFKKYAQFFWNKDYRIHVHANGDLGVEMVLNTLEELLEKQPKEDHRFTLHHLGYITEAQVKRMARLGAQGSIQPYYLYGMGSKYAKHGLGMERAQRISPVGNLIEHGIKTCFHSDFFMAPVEPLTLMWVAVNRKTIDGKTFGAELRISSWEALKAVTINAAHHLNQEDFIGSIKIGKSADFVILDKDPLKVDPEDLNTIQVVGTVFEGKKAQR